LPVGTSCARAQLVPAAASRKPQGKPQRRLTKANLSCGAAPLCARN
jgi:hypothetical protein